MRVEGWLLQSKRRMCHMRAEKGCTKPLYNMVDGFEQLGEKKRLPGWCCFGLQLSIFGHPKYRSNLSGLNLVHVIIFQLKIRPEHHLQVDFVNWLRCCIILVSRRILGGHCRKLVGLVGI